MLTDMKIRLAERFGWSLVDIDQADIVSLMRFIHRLNQMPAQAGPARRLTPIDQAGFLN